MVSGHKHAIGLRCTCTQWCVPALQIMHAPLYGGLRMLCGGLFILLGMCGVLYDDERNIDKEFNESW